MFFLEGHMKPLKYFFFLLAAVISSFFMAPSFLMAEEVPLFSEIRLGWLAHDIDAVSFNREHGPDVNAEVLFHSPDIRLVRSIGSPFPHLGITLNTQGDTSKAYAGLTWRWPLPGNFFFETMLGGAVHNGKLDLETDDRKALGSRMLFRLGAAVGYQISEHINISLMFDHISNAYLKEENEGLDTVGIHVGYRF